MDSRIPAAEQLKNTAIQQESTLEGVNLFKPGSNEYGSTNAEVTSAQNGTPIDVQQRAALKAINFYNENNQYKSPE